MEYNGDASNGGYKKKKKRSFLQNAKKFGRSGNFGKGKRLSEEEYSYYIRVLEQLKNIDSSEKYILIKNFFRELSREGEERSLASNQIISRILDDVLPIAPVGQVVALCQVFQEDIRTLCIDPYASHVVQTLLTLCLKYIQTGAKQANNFGEEEGGEDIPVTSEESKQLLTYITKVTKFVYNNLEEFIQETYASHIVRTVLEISSGVEVNKSIKTSNKSQTSHSLRQNATDVLNVPKKLSKTLSEIMTRLTRIPNLPDIIWKDCGSAVLQSALLVSKEKETEQCEELVSHLFEHGLSQLGEEHDYDKGVDIHNAFVTNSAVRLMEVVLQCANSDQQQKIYEQLFKSHINELVKHPTGNFAVQRLLSSWKCKDTFDDLYEEVGSCMNECLSCGHTGVIWSLVQACGNLKSHQSRCIQELMKLLQCYEPETKQLKFASLILYLIPEPKYTELKASGSLSPVSLHGALILQELLKYQKPIKVVNSILDMNDGDIALMSSCPRGSHVIDVFVTSESVGVKTRERLINKLRGSYSALACSKHGSRSLEALWKVAILKYKSQICSELVKTEAKLLDNRFGTIIYSNFQVRLYKRSGGSSDWQDLQQKEDKKRKILTDILKEDTNDNDIESKPKKKKKKKDKIIDDDQIFIDTTSDVE